MEALKAERMLPRRVRLRQCKYLNNIIEQDHRAVKKRVWLAKRIRLVSECVADLTGDRDDAHDQHGTSQVAGQGRRSRPGSLRCQPVRYRCVNREANALPPTGLVHAN